MVLKKCICLVDCCRESAWLFRAAEGINGQLPLAREDLRQKDRQPDKPLESESTEEVTSLSGKEAFRLVTEWKAKVLFLLSIFIFRRQRMLENMIIITNNPLVRERLAHESIQAVRYSPITYKAVLCAARDAIHQGHRLLTHPLSGSVKPGETPYKSIAISHTKGKMDMASLSLIEAAIATCDKFPIREKSEDPALQADFQTVDLSLIQSIF